MVYDLGDLCGFGYGGFATELFELIGDFKGSSSCAQIPCDVAGVNFFFYS